MPKLFLVISLAIICCTGTLHAQKKTKVQPMTNVLMGKILEEKTSKVEGGNGLWSVELGARVLYVITDETNNRMRIFTPILEQIDLEEEQKEKMLEANFHSALDAKYGIYQDIVVSLFTHPLGELTEPQFVDALYQVVNLANTFGTTYSSTGLIFGGVQEDEEEGSEKRINQSPSKTKRS